MAVAATLATEHPDRQLLIEWLIDQFAAQRRAPLATIGATEAQQPELAAWLGYQAVRGDIDVGLRRWPHLEMLLFRTFSDKVNKVAQRHCQICGGARPIDDQFPIHIFSIRMPARSRQAISGITFRALQAAIRHRFETRPIDLGGITRFCIAFTYVLDPRRRDPDVDNLTKATLDALSRALDFNDRHVHHLDIVKLGLRGSEEYIVVRIAPSYINEHDDIIAPVFNLDWAGTEPINIIDFLPPND